MFAWSGLSLSGELGLLPLPLWGRVGRGVMRRDNDGATWEGIALPPPPAPPHKGEGSTPNMRR
jgi:hypothetical protein